ncbi:MAG TPA: hypothetical protein VIC30_06335, partial [Orrella sp.]
MRRDVIYPNINIAIQFDMPDTFDRHCVLAWLNHLQPNTVAPDNRPDLSLNPTKAFIECCARLALTLLQLGRIPIFDTPKLLRVVTADESTQNGTRCRGDFQVQALDFVGLPIFELVFKVAVQLVAAVNSRSLSSDNRQAVYNHISQKVLGPLRAAIPGAGGQSTIPLLQCAHKLELPFIHIGGGVYQVGLASKRIRIDRGVVEHDSIIGAKLAANKALSAKALQMAGLPAPRHIVCRNREELIAQFDRLTHPVVI